MMNSLNNFIVRFWGVCGSYPKPGRTKLRHGGNTPCIEVQVNGFTLILDAGTGIIPLGETLARQSEVEAKPIQAIVLFSHYHHDHTQGFPFFQPAFLSSTRLHILGPNLDGAHPQLVLEEVMNLPHFPIQISELKAERIFDILFEGDEVWLGKTSGEIEIHHDLDLRQLKVDQFVRIQTLKSQAHPGGVLMYRISCGGYSVVYATDTESLAGENERLVAFAEGADLLIHDAQYIDSHYQGSLPGFPKTQGYGHSTTSMACQTAQLAGVDQLVLFHHSPEYEDACLDRIESDAKNLFQNTSMAYEGMTFRLK